MSYVRFSQDSDVYLIGTTAGNRLSDDHVIECCACKLTSDYRKARTEEELARVRDWDFAGVKGEDVAWNWGPVQHFRTIDDALAHLQAHVSAGHKVPERAFANVRGDDWLSVKEER